MPAKKSSPAKKTAARKKSGARVKATAARKPARKTSKSKAGGKSSGALHHVARSIGSTLGTLAKKTSKAVEAAKSALPISLHPESGE